MKCIACMKQMAFMKWEKMRIRIETVGGTGRPGEAALPDKAARGTMT